MRFLSFLQGASGVRGFLVSSEDGEQLQISGSVAKSSWTALRSAEIARDFGVAGGIAGLGTFIAAAVRSVESSRLLAQSGQSIALIDLEMTRATLDIEKQLQENEWASTEIEISDGPPSGPSDHETLPPQPETRTFSPPSSSASVSVSVQSPAVITAAAPVVAVPPRPFQGLPSIVGRAVPRPNAAAPVVAPRPAAPAVTTPPRAARPPLPPSRAQAAGAPESSSDVSRSAAVQASSDSTVTRKDEPLTPGSALLTGSLATFALPDLLEFLRVGQRTGTLVCASDAGLGAIHIKRGRITGAASPGVPSIGDWLVHRGALSQEKLHEALRHHTQSGATTQLGATLVKHNLVSRETLQEALVFHVGAVLRKLMTWETGAFTFDPATSETAVGVDIEIEPQAVLLNIFKEMDDAQRA